MLTNQQRGNTPPRERLFLPPPFVKKDERNDRKTKTEQPKERTAKTDRTKKPTHRRKEPKEPPRQEHTETNTNTTREKPA